MIIAHRIALDPNKKQATYFAKASGTARFTYNWALNEWNSEYMAGGKPSWTSLSRKLNSIKRDQFPWMMEVTKNAPQTAIIQLGNAFKNFFSKRAKYPKFHKKGARDHFYISNDQFRIDGTRIRIPRLGWVRMCEPLRFTGKVMSATVSRTADRWFVSVTVEMPDPPIQPNAENQGEVVGVDLGVSALATLSNGEVIVGPKPHKALLQRLQRLSRSLSRKQKGSQNRQKARTKLARLHSRIANIRNDALHKLTTSLTSRFSVICIEDLHVKGMLKNRHLSRSMSDMGFGEFRRQLTYKTAMRGVGLVVADRFFPSSKKCSKCGVVLESLLLSIRDWKCASCGASHNRDVNAALNLKSLAAGPTVSACGEEGADCSRKTTVKPSSVKQESNTKATCSF